MLIVTDKNMWMRKGDTGQVEIGGLPRQAGLGVYLSLYNPETNKIIKEFPCYLYDSTVGIATFLFSPAATDDVPPAEYAYAVKTCLDGWEDTIVPELVIQDGYVVEQPAPIFIIAAKLAEGSTSTIEPSPTVEPTIEPTPEPTVSIPAYAWEYDTNEDTQHYYTLNAEPSEEDLVYMKIASALYSFGEITAVEEDFSQITVGVDQEEPMILSRDSDSDTTVTEVNVNTEEEQTEGEP